MSYVEGFVFAVPTAQKEAFRAYAARADAAFVDHGALEVVECWGDEVPEGEVTSMPMAVRLEPGETVVFSWIRWPSKAVRDGACDGLKADPRMADPLPFDGKRVILGGFVPIVDLRSEKES